MQRAFRNNTYDFHSPLNVPQFTVKPGEVFLAETELCSGGWLRSIEDSWTPERSCALNPTVCIAIEGAKQGDILAVDILDITPDTIGYTGFTNRSNPLASLIAPRDWGMNTKTVPIIDGFVHWSDKLHLPIRPMIGTLGTAPAVETLSNAKGGAHGGNMDIQEVCAGATVYLPVEVPGALLHIGDVHALQGDGEINNAGGIECRSVVKLSARLLPRDYKTRCVRIENDSHIMTAACERSIEESFYTATAALLEWMASYGMTYEDAYLLLGQVLEARCTQFVNPTRSYVCKIAKRYL